MKTVRALIVDDEPLARRELRRLLASQTWLDTADEAASVGDAERACRRAEAEGRPFGLLLLDVEMPDGTGFDLLERLGTTPEVIFVTAYDHHAVRAFRTDALDYLVKPVDPRELAQALSRLQRGRVRGAAEPPLAPPQGGTRLFVKDGTRTVLIPLADIRLIEAAGDYVRIDHGRPPASVLSARSLAALEPRLPDSAFFRANRQQIVGLDHIAELQPAADSRLRARLDDGATVLFSARRSTVFRERFGG
jgi:two-component system LytT family response regulator